MSIIALPKKIDFHKGKEPNQASVVIEPLFPGYGITLGNSLRRVLHSSLPGAAPIAVKIKGADHEFATLANVKEDILEIILKLKKLKLKIFTEEEIVLEIEEHGKKTVKASDIKKNSQVEIVNPDMEIANITDVAGALSMQIIVAPGKGYETIESREASKVSGEKKEKEIGYIEMDSIFSPVLSIGIDVDNVRVGKMTNWDKLILDIVTDGSITPEEAFYNSVNILIDQFSALSLEKKKADESESGKKSAKKEEVEEDEADVDDDVTEKKETNKKEDDTEDEEEKPAAPKKKRGRPRKTV